MKRESRPLIGPQRRHGDGTNEQEVASDLRQTRKLFAPTIRCLQTDMKSQILRMKIAVHLQFRSIWTAASLQLNQNQNLHTAGPQTSLLCPPTLSSSLPGL